MLNVSFWRNKEKTQSAFGGGLPECGRAETPVQLAEMRRLTADEYATVAGGPEMQVGDGGG